VGRLFGTDGVRGVANAPPLTPELAYRLGRVTAALLAERRAGAGRPGLLVGRDTRLSGPLLEAALLAGIMSSGVDGLTVGVLPTPGIACLTRRLGAIGGAVISASHNPFEDNGIKFFSADGGKLPDAWEEEVETRLAEEAGPPRPTGAAIGRLRPVRSAEALYLDAVRAAFPATLDLGGLRLVLDCAHGATYRVAPRLFRGLGAEVVTVGARPNGTNINARCGALHPEGLQARVRAEGAHLGLAFDGDGDRLITVDEAGEVRDGDYLLALLGRHLHAEGLLRGGCVVTTAMANLGLDRALTEVGIRAVRTQVGDRYVLEEMHRLGANLGGEQSGHLIFLDHAPTGDGLISALQLLRVMRLRGASLGELSRCLTKFPQVLVNVPVRAKPPLASLPRLSAAVREWEARLGDAGRILLRYSGTEPLARIMVEGEERTTIETVAGELASVLRAEMEEAR